MGGCVLWKEDERFQDKRRKTPFSLLLSFVLRLTSLVFRLMSPFSLFSFPFSLFTLPFSYVRSMQRVHFIAIGGAAMHNLAMALSDGGMTITGSDDKINEPSRSRLAAKGVLPAEEGWFPERISKDLDAVILGMHAHADNPELAKAQELGIPIYSFPEFVYERTKDKKRVVIGGSHGKTTITSMILHVARDQGVEVDFLVGAQLEGFDNMVSLTDTAKYAVIEGDEYLSSALDRSPKFLHYRPNVAIVSGIAWDHANVFPTFDNYQDQFREFIYHIQKDGKLIYCREDGVTADVCETTPADIMKVPYYAHDHEIKDGRTFLRSSQKLYPVEVFGEHNMQNLTVAKLACMELGISEEQYYESIQSFKGASLRSEPLADNDKATIFRDFAHSPSKVKATVEAFKGRYEGRRLVAFFELHTYSSLNKEFMKLYAGAMAKADVAIVYYDPAVVQQKRLESISKEDVKYAFQRNDLVVLNDKADIRSTLEEAFNPGDVVLLMSSGNFGGLDLKELVATLSA